MQLESYHVSVREEFEKILAEMQLRASGKDMRDLAARLFDLAYEHGQDTVEQCDCYD